MTLDEAKELLKSALDHRGELDCLRPFVGWRPGQERIVLDGKFTADQLEAMVVFMRSRG